MVVVRWHVRLLTLPSLVRSQYIGHNDLEGRQGSYCTN